MLSFALVRVQWLLAITINIILYIDTDGCGGDGGARVVDISGDTNGNRSDDSDDGEDHINIVEDDCSDADKVMMKMRMEMMR